MATLERYWFFFSLATAAAASPFTRFISTYRNWPNKKEKHRHQMKKKEWFLALCHVFLVCRSCFPPSDCPAHIQRIEKDSSDDSGSTKGDWKARQSIERKTYCVQKRGWHLVCNTKPLIHLKKERRLSLLSPLSWHTPKSVFTQGIYPLK